MVVITPYEHIERIGCFGCNSTKLRTDSYSCELICANCGLVIADKVEDRQIYENTEGDSTPSTSNQLSSYDMGLYTNILDTSRDARVDVFWMS